LSDIQINLSTTALGPDGLSATFAGNVGADDTVVYRRGALTLSSAGAGPPGGPRDFDITVALTTPFLYDPARGNLLLDVRLFGGSGMVPALDAHFVNDDAVSRVLGGVNGATGGRDSLGLVTQFRFAAPQQAVPEPMTLLLLGTGLAGVAARARGRRARHTAGDGGRPGEGLLT
jgi:hypothetical protein